MPKTQKQTSDLNGQSPETTGDQSVVDTLLGDSTDADQIRQLIAQKNEEIKELKKQAKPARASRSPKVTTPDEMIERLNKYPSGHVFMTLLSEASKVVALAGGTITLKDAIEERAAFYGNMAATMSDEWPENMSVTTFAWDYLADHDMLASADRKRVAGRKDPLPSLKVQQLDETGSDVELEVAATE